MTNNIMQKIIKKKLTQNDKKPDWGLRSWPIPSPSEITKTKAARKIKKTLLTMFRLSTCPFRWHLSGRKYYSGAVAASLMIPVAIKCLFIFFQ